MIPLRLVMDNFASHQHSVLDFTKFDSALIIGAKDGNPDVSNATGKTTIFRAIFWALFGKSDFSIKEKVVRRGKSSCSVEFRFSVSDAVYRVIRKLNKKSNTIDVNFAKKDGKEWISSGFTCNTPTMTNRRIEDVVGVNYETGINSLYFKQNDTFGFAGSKASNRKDILKEILNIGIWDVFQQDAKDCEKKLDERREVLKDRLEHLTDIGEEKEKTLGNLATAEQQMEAVKEEIALLAEQLKSLDTELVDARVSAAGQGSVDVHKLQARLAQIDDNMRGIAGNKELLRGAILSNNGHLQAASEAIGGLEKRLFEDACLVLAVAERANDKARKIFLDMSVCRPTPLELPTPEHSRAALESKMQERSEVQRRMEASFLEWKRLLSLEPGKECPTCLSDIRNPEEVVARRKERERELTKCVEAERLKLQTLDSAIDAETTIIRQADEAYVEMERTELRIAKHMANISEYHKRNEESQEALEDFAKTEREHEAERIEIRRLLESSGADPWQRVSDIECQKEQLESQIAEDNAVLMKCGIVQGNARGYLDELERRESERAALLEEDQKFARSTETYKKLARAFGKDGIQAIIMENVTEDLKDYANAVLKQVCDEQMSVNFVTQRQTGTGGWKEDFDIQIITRDSVEDFDDLSGGEQVRVAIALRLALSQLLMNRIGRNIQFLLLDEVDRDLDRQGIEALADVIRKLSKRFKILVITHNELMKEKFEHILVVQKGPDGSVLKQ
jgi:DNA repair exonuclease SbcCD ATPase subunit